MAAAGAVTSMGSAGLSLTMVVVACCPAASNALHKGRLDAKSEVRALCAESEISFIEIVDA